MDDHSPDGTWAVLRELAAREGNVCGFRTYVHKSCQTVQDVCRKLGMVEKEYVVFEDML